MKIIHFSVYIIMLCAVVFFYTGCPASVPDPEPTPAPTRLPPVTITGLAEVGIIDTKDAAVIVSQGDYLYYTGSKGYPGNLGIIDFSYPLYPVIMGTLTIGYGQGIAVMGGYIFVDMDGDGVTGSQWEYGCVASFDVSKSESINFQDLETLNHNIGNPLYYKTGYLYSCGLDAVSIYNVTDPKDIKYITEIPTVFCIWAAFQDDYLYLSNDMKVTIYNITMPSSPELMGEAIIDEGSGGNGGIAVSGNYAYVGDLSAGAKIFIVDVSDPATPVYMTSIPVSTTGCVNELRILSHYLLGVADLGFFVLDISEPLSPVEVDYIPLTNYGWGFTISGRFAIVSDDTLYRVIMLLWD